MTDTKQDSGLPYSTKLVIYVVLITVMIGVRYLMSLTGGLLGILMMPLAVVVHIWFVIETVKDAEAIGANKVRAGLLVFFLGIIGALIYYFLNKGKR